MHLKGQREHHIRTIGITSFQTFSKVKKVSSERREKEHATDRSTTKNGTLGDSSLSTIVG